MLSYPPGRFSLLLLSLVFEIHLSSARAPVFTPSSRSDPFFSFKVATPADLHSFSPHNHVIWTDGFILFGKLGSTLLPTTFFVAQRPSFLIQQAQSVEAFLLKPESFCELFAGLGSISNIATILPFSSSQTLALSSLRFCFLCPFFLSHTLWYIWHELSVLFFSSTIKLKWELIFSRE